MDRGGSRKTAWRAVALGLTLAVVAGACGSSGTKKSGGKASAPVPVRETTLGQVFVDHPLAGATVKLYTPSGSLIKAAGAYEGQTSPAGFFSLHPKRLPKDFTVVVSEGTDGGALFTGDVRAVVAGYDGGSDVGVNPVTSVIAAYHDSHKSESVTQSTRRVKQFLGIGSLVDVGLPLAASAEVFSGKSFLDAAQAGGGFNAFVTSLAGDVSAGKPPRSFAGPPPNAVPFGAILSLSLLIAKFGYCVGTTQTTTAGQGVALGCTLKAIGATGGGTDPAVLATLNDINQKLSVITQQLTELDNKLSAIGNAILQNQWNGVVQGLQTGFYGQINTAFTDMLNATNTTYPASDRQRAAADAQTIMENLSTGSSAGADFSMSQLLIGAGGATGAIRQFSDLVRAQSGKFFRNPNSVTRGGVSASTIQDEWDYLDAWQAKLEYLMVERANVKGYTKGYVEQNVVFPYLGSPAYVPNTDPPQPVPLSSRTQNCPPAPVTATNCRGWRDQEVRLVPKPLPAGTVLDTTTGLMWYQRVLAPNPYDTPDPNCPPKPGGGYLACPPTGITKDLNANRYPTLSNFGFTNWGTPEKDGLEAFVRGVPSGMSVGDWLSQAGGFFYLGGIQSDTQIPVPQFPSLTAGESRAWTSTISHAVSCSDCLGGYLANYVVNLIDGKTGSENANYKYNKRLWSLAFRPLAQCEFYYDDVTKSSPAC
jgi:hypothetical protein